MRRLRPLASLAVLGALWGGSAPRPATAQTLSLEQVLQQALPTSLRTERARRQLQRDGALVQLNQAQLLPRLNLVGLASYTGVNTSVGLLTNLPTLGDLSFSLPPNGYAELRNSFANLGVLLDADLLPLGRLALLRASREQQRSSAATLEESERQARFELVNGYRQLQLSQALLPVWTQALEGSTALERTVASFLKRGLAARLDLERARALRAADQTGLQQIQARLLADREQLAALMGLASGQELRAADPILEQPPWPLDLAATLEASLRQRPLLEALRRQQQAQAQEARAARASLLPSLALVAGFGYSGNRLAVPVLRQGGSLGGASPLTLPERNANGAASGSFSNWGAALLLRQPLWDGGQAAAAARVAERQADLLAADADLARQRIRQDVSRAWSDLHSSAAAIAAARESVRAGERALRDAQLRYRALVDPLTEVLLVQRDLQASRAALLTSLTRQALDRSVLELETGLIDPGPDRSH
jgi:outer membrane protein